MSLKRLGSKKSPKKDDDKPGPSRKGEISIIKSGSLKRGVKFEEGVKKNEFEKKRAPGNRKESKDHGIKADPVARV